MLQSCCDSHARDQHCPRHHPAQPPILKPPIPYLPTHPTPSGIGDGLVPSPMATNPGVKGSITTRLAAIKKKSPKEIFFGNYDWKFLCWPNFNPWSKRSSQPLNFYPVDSWLGLFLAIVMVRARKLPTGSQPPRGAAHASPEGFEAARERECTDCSLHLHQCLCTQGFQHAMAMIGGIITPPLLIYNVRIT